MDSLTWGFASEELETIRLTSEALKFFFKEFKYLEPEKLRAIRDHNLPRLRDRISSLLGVPTERALKYEVATGILQDLAIGRENPFISENGCLRNCSYADTCFGKRACSYLMNNGSTFQRLFGFAERVDVGDRCIHPGALYPGQP